MSAHGSTAVVVPVYNALDRVTRCLRAVSATVPSDTKVLVINDASPDPRVQPTLERLAAELEFDLLENPSNLGFVGTCNRAFSEVQDDHVLLLNSDTEPYAGWFESMVKAVADDVASVTAISNNASIYSLPEPGIDPFSPDFQPKDLARAVATAPTFDPIEIPVGVGFCMLMTRRAIDQVGGFDSVFGRGYGEENDWCMRATKAGFRHLLAPAAFVFHEGGASMSEAGVLEKGVGTHPENEALLNQRHPHYRATVVEFLGEPQIHLLRKEVSRGLIDSVRETRPRVLHWLHADPWGRASGGTELSVRRIIDAGQREFHSTVVFPAGDRSVVVHERANGASSVRHLSERELGIRQGRHHDDWRLLAQRMIEVVNPTVVHMHHAYRTSLSVLEAAIEARVPTILSLHDFHLICPRNHLFDRWQGFCGVPSDASRCDSCVDRRQSGMPMSAWRERAARILSNVDVITVASESVIDLVDRAVPIPSDARIEVIPPVAIPIALQASESSGPRETGAPVVVIPGRVEAPHKGGIILKELVTRLTNHGVEVHSVGSAEPLDRDIDGFTVHGTYDPGDLTEILTRIGPDFAIIPSVVPETYSLTLGEMWGNGIPVLALSVGSIAERIGHTGAGWTVDSGTASAIADVAIRIASDPPRLEAARVAVADAAKELAASPSSAGAYLGLYHELAGL